MGEEVRMDEYKINVKNNNRLTADDDDDDERISEWEVGLPTADDLMPLAQPLIPPELASAFSISPGRYRTVMDVNRASQTTLCNIRGGQMNALSSSNNFKSFNETTTGQTNDPMVVELEEEEGEEVEEERNGAADRDGNGSEARKLRRIDSEEADSALRTEDDPSSAAARTLKRPRLVWTPQLHKRFVDVVGHLGIKNAVPKTIMQLMNVEGLTRENVASHLQKYRLYLKRMQGLSTEGPSASDQLFASTPVPQSLNESGGSGGGGNANGNFGMPIPVPYHHPGAGGMMPMPVYGHMDMHMRNNHNDIHSNNHHHHHHHQGNNYQNGYNGNVVYGNVLQQRDWNGNHLGPYYHQPHHVAPKDNM